MITYNLSDDLNKAVQATINDWQNNHKMQRLWAQDASLWTGADEASWLGWLNIVAAQIANAQQFRDFVEDVKQAGCKNILLLGMGGSSLCPEVLKLTFGKVEGFPEIHVLDSTDPAQVKTLENKIDLAVFDIYILKRKKAGSGNFFLTGYPKHNNPGKSFQLLLRIIFITAFCLL